MTTTHYNNLPPYLQKKVDEAVGQVLADYAKKHSVHLLIGEKIPMIKRSYQKRAEQEIRLADVKRMMDPLFE